MYRRNGGRNEQWRRIELDSPAMAYEAKRERAIIWRQRVSCRHERRHVSEGAWFSGLYCRAIGSCCDLAPHMLYGMSNRNEQQE
jgi:hypothetical protein